MSSSLATYIGNQTGPRGYDQFRMITEVKGVEFGSPVYTFARLLTVLVENSIEHGDLKKIMARKAGTQEWVTF